MKCGKCNEEIRRIYSIAGDGPDDYMPSCGCIDWDGWIALGIALSMIAILIVIARIV